MARISSSKVEQDPMAIPVTGSAGDDDLNGGDGSDTLTGLGGADLIRAGGGDDIVEGGDEDRYGDGIDGGAGDDTLNGGAGDDVIGGGSGSDLINGGAGSDVLGGDGGGVTFVIGTSGPNGAGPAVRFMRLSDPFREDNAPDQLNGGAGDDFIYVGFRDSAEGGDGVDTLALTFLSRRFGLDRLDLSSDPHGALAALTGGHYTGFERFSVQGTSLDDTIIGSQGVDNLDGERGTDRLYGESGDDTLRGGGGSDRLDGGEGSDLALYSGFRRQYTASSATVSGGPEGGTDTLVSIEGARFLDGTLSFDENTAYAQVVRLFDTLLDRAPGQAALELQANAALNGVSLLQLTQDLLSSAEYEARANGASNQTFVEQLYQSALGRNASAADVRSWVALLEGGASRAQVALGFSESAEHRLHTSSTINAGLWIPDSQALMVARLYDAAFDRLPDAAGLSAWLDLIHAGLPVSQVAASFVGSPEFHQTFGTLNNNQFVQQLYRSALNREGDAAGVGAWTNLLDQGASRAQVLLSFSESTEHLNLTAALWSEGVRVAVDPAVAEHLPGALDADDVGSWLSLTTQYEMGSRDEPVVYVAFDHVQPSDAGHYPQAETVDWLWS